jgi:5-methyltetrahydropteroyltriglutamate--homocysteine methyltransferase
MTLPIIPTMLVGSYPQPGWLINRDVLLGNGPPRVRMQQVWQMKDDALDEAQNDAVLTAVHEQERAGIDILTDGEIRRESYFNAFATALDGIDLDNPGQVLARNGKPTLVPRVVGEIKLTRSVHADEVRFLKSQTDRPIKVTIPGGFTMAKLALDEHYHDQETLIMAYAAAVNAEIKQLKAAGADWIQIDEPYMQANPEEANKFGVAAINRALEGVEGPTVVHLCFGYAYVVSGKPAGYSYLPQLNACKADAISIEAAQPGLDPLELRGLPDKKVVYGVIDLADPVAETPELVAERLRGALGHIDAGRLIAAPDCGMKYLPRGLAFAKLKALADGAAQVRATL